ncbi:GAF domain-containing protein [Methylobacterium sp. NPDC014830]
MEARVRAHDWSATPIGPIADWPEALRSAARLVLDMALPAALGWGEASTLLCNDAFAALLDGGTDPLGQPFAALGGVSGSEALAALVERVRCGEAVPAADLALGGGPAGDAGARVALSLTPLRRADGTVAGLLAIVTDTRATGAEPPAQEPQARESRAEAALRVSEEKYSTLFQTMGQGFCELELVRDTTGRAVDWRYIEVNPAFERLVGPPAALARGRRGRDFVPEIDPWWFETYEHIVATGVPRRLEHTETPQGRWYEVSVYPQAGDRLLVLYDDVTQRKTAEAALREREERQAFLLAMSDAVRRLTDPAAIQGEACRLLAGRLDVERAYYVAVDETLGLARVARDYVRGDAPSLAGEHRIADFAWSVAILRRDECHVVADTQTSPAVPPADRPALAALRIAACMGAPLVKDGQLVGALCVTQSRPREWTGDEVELLRDVAERIWAAVERGRAEADIRHKNAVLEGINRIFREALGASTEEELGRACLAIAEEVTGSAFSFMGEINVEADRFDELSISDRGWQHFAMDGSVFPAGKAPTGLPIHGLYGRVLRDGKGLIFNEPQTHPDRIGTPPGHPPLKAFLGVPLRRDGRTIGMIGLGNRAGGYRPEDLEAAEALAPAILQALLRKRTADTLRESEERFRTLTELVPSLLWDADPQGRTALVNRRWTEYTGQTLAEVQNGGWLAVIHPDDAQETARIFADAYATGHGLERQHRIRRRDGVYRWFLVRHAPARDAEGGILRWYGAATDIHDQHVASENLRAEESRQAFLLDLADRLQRLTDPQAALQTVAEALGHHLGVSRLGYARVSDDGERVERQVGYPAQARTRLGPLPIRVFGEGIHERLRNGETVLAEDVASVSTFTIWSESAIRSLLAVPLVREDRLRAVLYAIRREPHAWTRSETKLVEEVAARTWEAAERAQAETELRASEARQRALIEGIPQLVWRSAMGGGWTWASPQWCRYTGQSEAEPLGFGWLDALHPDDRERVRTAWTEAEAASGLTLNFRIRSDAEDRYRWFQSRALPLLRESENSEWLGTSTDIDDLRRLQEQQDVMVAELQHRTRNLITVVRSIAEQTMASSASLDVFRRRFYDRLAVLSRVQGLLSRSNVEPVLLDTVITAELDALGAWEAAERILLEGPSVRLRKATVQTFALALHELATNARKYGALAVPSGRLQVTWRTYDEDGRTRLALQWTEEGIEGPSATAPPARYGYGRELIEKALPYALDARTHYALGEHALHCSIDLPLTDRRGSERATDHP